uniref:S100 calcium binding protein A7-like 3 n=1 Tax=Homo sapiens TaxID=9606 RepID=Q5M770_HUMAN|nr:TPA: S100 calcium binding protein A7-like 3 [Homo sapiens]
MGAEEQLKGLLNLCHKYTRDSDAMGRSGCPTSCISPTFLSALKKKKSPDFLEKLFKKDKNHEEKINFSEFVSSVAAVAKELHHQSHGQKPCSKGYG